MWVLSMARKLRSHKPCGQEQQQQQNQTEEILIKKKSTSKTNKQNRKLTNKQKNSQVLSLPDFYMDSSL